MLSRHSLGKTATLLMLLGGALLVLPAEAGAQSDAPPKESASELDKLVAPVALYPDPLLAQVLAASSFPDQIPGAAQWANMHKTQKGDDLAKAMEQYHLGTRDNQLMFAMSFLMSQSDIENLAAYYAQQRKN